MAMEPYEQMTTHEFNRTSEMRNSWGRVYLYGLDEMYKVVRYRWIPRCNMSIAALKQNAEELKAEYPNITHVFAVDNSYSIYSAYREATKTPLTEPCVIFKTLLEQYGQRM